jgi:hypothetical protein
MTIVVGRIKESWSYSHPDPQYLKIFFYTVKRNLLIRLSKLSCIYPFIQMGPMIIRILINGRRERERERERERLICAAGFADRGRGHGQGTWVLFKAQSPSL